MAWYNDAGGLTIGLRSRENYLGRFDRNETFGTVSTGWGVNQADNPVKRTDWFLRLRTTLHRPGMSQELRAFSTEGRDGAAVIVSRERRSHLTFGPVTTSGLALEWLSVRNGQFLEPGRYEDRSATLEGRTFFNWKNRAGAWSLGSTLTLGLGASFTRPGPGQITVDRRDTQMYLRGTIEGTVRRPLGAGFAVSFRGFVGVVDADRGIVKQRQIFLSGADPYQELLNPFVRSRGALLLRPDLNFQTPGGAGIRGLARSVSADQAYALTGELERALRTRPDGRLFNRVALVAFGDAAFANGDINTGTGSSGPHVVADAGIGLRRSTGSEVPAS